MSGHKTIYSKTLQRIIVVAEYARGEGKAGRSNITTYPIADSFCALRQLSWRIALATGSLLILPLAQAQIVADPQAPREHQPQVLLSTEQLPQVDIQTPSAAGVSVNEYRQFDVSQEGALLNNSRKGAPTHTGGWVSGNPNLIKGEAQVIVNQINSSNPSQLRGQIEVAGQKADVILANPAGISVNGSGFINAGKTWLTTGSPQLENGVFNGVNVERGTVHIGERGLDVRNADYAAIIAKASKIDGPVQAGDRPLDVITGSNHVASDGKITAKGGSNTGSANTAIDTGQLGGMYGGSIRLISTDQGGGNYHYRYHGEDKGVETTGDGALSVSATAGKLTVNAAKLTVNAAKLNSGKNRVQLYGAKGIDVTHSEIIDKEVTSSNRRGGGLISRSRTRDYQSWESHQVKSSDITGDTVALVADRGNINATGSNIVGEHGTLLQTRQGNITLKAGENTYHSEERHSKHKVGLMGSGGIGVTLGSRSQSSDATLDLKGHTATVVGAIDGNVTIHAAPSLCWVCLAPCEYQGHQLCHFIDSYSTTEPSR